MTERDQAHYDHPQRFPLDRALALKEGENIEILTFQHSYELDGVKYEEPFTLRITRIVPRRKDLTDEQRLMIDYGLMEAIPESGKVEEYHVFFDIADAEGNSIGINTGYIFWDETGFIHIGAHNIGWSDVTVRRVPGLLAEATYQHITNHMFDVWYVSDKLTLGGSKMYKAILEKTHREVLKPKLDSSHQGIQRLMFDFRGENT